MRLFPFSPLQKHYAVGSVGVTRVQARSPAGSKNCDVLLNGSFGATRGSGPGPRMRIELRSANLGLWAMIPV